MEFNGNLKWLTYLVYIILILSVAFTAWTANEVIAIKDTHVTLAEYREDMHRIHDTLDRIGICIDDLKDVVYSFHLDKG